jgi:hypothetical protein
VCFLGLDEVLDNQARLAMLDYVSLDEHRETRSDNDFQGQIGYQGNRIEEIPGDVEAPGAVHLAQEHHESRAAFPADQRPSKRVAGVAADVPL